MVQTASHDTSQTSPALPDLEPGVTLLTVDTDTTHAIHALAVDRILCSGGDGYWIDTGRQAQTEPLVDIAPSDRILDRMHVARAFTPFQHLDCLRALPQSCPKQTSLVVVPRADLYYRDDNLLGDEGREMFLASVAALTGLARRREIPVLVTRHTADSFSQPLAAAATQTLTCTATPFGPRFQSDEAETLVYPVDGRETVQTTLAFWERIITARQPVYEQSPSAQPEVPAYGAD